jgi:hypothetical protein
LTTERAQALAAASQDFAEASLDVHAVLHTVTRQVAELLGDLCIVRLLSEDHQWLNPVAMYHPDTALRGDLAERLLLASRRQRATGHRRPYRRASPDPRVRLGGRRRHRQRPHAGAQRGSAGTRATRPHARIGPSADVRPSSAP